MLVTVGATEAIAAALLALCEPGDEVVMFEPTYDSYAACCAMAGARAAASCACTRPTGPSTPTSWPPPPAARRRSSSCSTRRTTRRARCSRPTSWAQVAALCRPTTSWRSPTRSTSTSSSTAPHVPLATLPGMRERTLTISSGGKTFSFTGWKVGWVGAAGAVGRRGAGGQAVPHLHQPGPLPARDRPRPRPPARRHATASPPSWRPSATCSATGWPGSATRSTGPAATYFATTDIAPVAPGLSADDFCLALPARCGVVAIPSSVFYDPADPEAGRTLVRWAFCKRDDVLHDALARLASWSP